MKAEPAAALKEPRMPHHLFTLLLTLFALFTGSDPVEASTGDNGSILDPDGRP